MRIAVEFFCVLLFFLFFFDKKLLTQATALLADIRFKIDTRVCTVPVPVHM